MLNMRLNKAAFVWAQEMISSKSLAKEGFDWDAFREDVEAKEALFESAGVLEASMWFLAVDPDKDPNSPDAYDLPMGDFTRLYTGALGAIKDFANDEELYQVQDATIKLLEMAGIRDYSK